MVNKINENKIRRMKIKRMENRSNEINTLTVTNNRESQLIGEIVKKDWDWDWDRMEIEKEKSRKGID